MKKSSMYVWALFFLSAASFVSCSQSCSLTEKKDSDGKVNLKILNWNLQTFFDGTFDGSEYTEFASSSQGWCKEKYSERVQRAVEVFNQADADVIVLEELEKQEQLQDFFNLLSTGFNLSKNYSYGTFAKSEGSSIGCGIISRYPLENLTLHSLDVRSVSESQPSMRPVISVYVKAKEKKLLLLVNHWKSKSGGEEESEVWRNYQEAVLADCMEAGEEKGVGVVACGDFNRDISEFQKVSGRKSQTNLVLRGKNEVPVYSPWFDSGGNLIEPGSYWYNQSWDRIDHFFCGKTVTITSFKVENQGPWKSEDGYPLKYLIKYGTGYSDHFPISCNVSW